MEIDCSKQTGHRILINNKGINIKDIIFIKCNDHISTIHLKNGKNEYVTRSISEFEKQLGDYGFIRIHRNTLINELYIIKIDKKKQFIHLAEKIMLKVARRMLKFFKN